MTTRWIFGASIAILAPLGLDAQTAPNGDLRVRQADGTVITGTLVEMAPGVLRLEDAGVIIDIERSRIRTVERRLGSHGSFAKSFFGSIGVGALLVGAASALSYDCTSDDCWLGRDGHEGAFAIGAIVGGVVAIPVGVAVGIAAQSERWEEVTLPPTTDFALLLRSSPDGGVAVGVRLTIPRRPRS
ncbi:MAG: hypothetical protein ABL963_16460 [Longimicrobiales bacterium]